MTRKLIILIAVYVVAITAYAMMRPTPMDWTESFDRNDRIPFGTYVMFNELESILRPTSLEVSSLPIYNEINREQAADGTRLYICPAFILDDLDTWELLSWVETGNTAFISANGFSDLLLEELEVEMNLELMDTFSVEQIVQSSNRGVELTFVPETQWDLPSAICHVSFTIEDSVLTQGVTGLGEYSNGNLNFVRAEYGEGAIYMHTLPHTFTNYLLLDSMRGAAGYSAAVLSHLNEGEHIVWDDYYATGGLSNRNPFQVMGQYRGFRWSYWIVIVTVLLFVIFTARRKQRAIPLIEPRRNTSLDFIRTIGDLYFQRGSHGDLAMKKIAYYHTFVKTNYRTELTDYSQDEATQLAERSGKQPEVVKALFKTIQELNKAENINREMLIDLQRQFDLYYERK